MDNDISKSLEYSSGDFFYAILAEKITMANFLFNLLLKKLPRSVKHLKLFNFTITWQQKET